MPVPELIPERLFLYQKRADLLEGVPAQYKTLAQTLLLTCPTLPIPLAEVLKPATPADCSVLKLLHLRRLWQPKGVKMSICDGCISLVDQHSLPKILSPEDQKTIHNAWKISFVEAAIASDAYQIALDLQPNSETIERNLNTTIIYTLNPQLILEDLKTIVADVSKQRFSQIIHRGLTILWQYSPPNVQNLFPVESLINFNYRRGDPPSEQTQRIIRALKSGENPQQVRADEQLNAGKAGRLAQTLQKRGLTLKLEGKTIREKVLEIIQAQSISEVEKIFRALPPNFIRYYLYRVPEQTDFISLRRFSQSLGISAGRSLDSLVTFLNDNNGIVHREPAKNGMWTFIRTKDKVKIAILLQRWAGQKTLKHP